MKISRFFGVLTLLFLLFAGTPMFAQQMHVSSPMHRGGDSFSESIGCNWGLSGKNWFVNVGGNQGATLPQFGNFDMNSGLRTGFQFQKGGTSGYFNGWAGQSFNRYNQMESPSVTFMNGQHAYFQDVTETPFVVGFVPVVNTWQNGQYQPFNDPEVTLSTSVLDQKIDQLQQKKNKPRAVRETPNAPALKELREETKPKHSVRRASKSTSVNADGNDAGVSRSRNSHTADAPALSVSEMKRRNRAKKQSE